MSSPHLPAAPAADGDSEPRWVRARSAVGVVPLGFYVVGHVVLQSSAMGGFRDYEAVLLRFRSIPAWWLVELTLLGSLAFHALGGACLVVRRMRRDAGTRLLRPFHLQALSGLALLLFLAVHVWQFRVRAWRGELSPADCYDELRASLSSTVGWGIPLQAGLYLVGVGAVSFHLAQGLQALTSGGKAGRRGAALGRASVVLGLLLFCLGALLVIELATGPVISRTE